MPRADWGRRVGFNLTSHRSPWSLYVNEARTGLLNKDPPEVPMVLGYGVPAYSLAQTDDAVFNTLRKFGPVPIFWNGNVLYLEDKNHLQDRGLVPQGARLLSGIQTFDFCIAAREEYYIRWADHCILEDDSYLPLFTEWMNKTHVLELCAGTGGKARKLLNRVMRAGATPASYTLNDIVAESLHAAKLEICGTQYPHDKTDFITANIFSSRFDQFLTQYQCRSLRSPIPVLFLLQGTTISNFDPPQMEELLTKIRQVFGPKDRIVVSADSTIHLPTLQAAYNHYFYKQFFTSAYLFACKELGLHGLDYSAIDCEINFNIQEHRPSKDEGTEVTINIINTSPQTLGPLSMRTTTFKAGPMRAGRMRKLSVKQWEAAFKAYGFRLEHVLPAAVKKRGKFRHVKHNYLAFTL